MSVWEGYAAYIFLNVVLATMGTVLAIHDKHAYAWLPWVLIAISQFKMPSKDGGKE